MKKSQTGTMKIHLQRPSSATSSGVQEHRQIDLGTTLWQSREIASVQRTIVDMSFKSNVLDNITSY